MLCGFDINKNIHAFLISEPGLLRARKYADSLAEAMLCDNTDKDGMPCGICPSCIKAKCGTHPDIYVLGRNKVSVDDVRNVRKEAYLAPNESDRKVFVLEGIDKFNAAAQNALLKILEEPPKGVNFVLTASSKIGVLPTVLSRVCIITPENCDEKYYENVAKSVSGKSGEDADKICAYLEMYKDTDAESLPINTVYEAFDLADRYYRQEITNIVPLFPKKKDEIAIYFKVFMLVARNVFVYKLSGGKAEIKPSNADFKRMCVKMSAKRAAGYYEIFEKAYNMNDDYANTNALYAYLSQKI